MRKIFKIEKLINFMVILCVCSSYYSLPCITLEITWNLQFNIKHCFTEAGIVLLALWPWQSCFSMLSSLSYWDSKNYLHKFTEMIKYIQNVQVLA